MLQILDSCFEGKTKIDKVEFQKMTEEKTSDMVLSVLSLFRERLPCSENFWRYKRNYELHMKMVEQSNQGGAEGGNNMSRSQSPPDSNMSPKILIAQAHMNFVKPLSPYAAKGSPDQQAHFSFKNYDINKFAKQ